MEFVFSESQKVQIDPSVALSTLNLTYISQSSDSVLLSGTDSSYLWLKSRNQLVKVLGFSLSRISAQYEGFLVLVSKSRQKVAILKEKGL